MKPVVAVPGDHVMITTAGVAVNGVVLPDSAVATTDSNGAPIPHLPHGWRKHLGDGEYFTLSTHQQRSLDSRYYGIIKRDAIFATTAPLLTR